MNKVKRTSQSALLESYVGGTFINYYKKLSKIAVRSKEYCLEFWEPYSYLIAIEACIRRRCERYGELDVMSINNIL